MKKSFFLFIFALSLILTAPVSAQTMPAHLSTARALLEKINPDFSPLFRDTAIRLTDEKMDALATYIPSTGNQKRSTIQFRKTIKSYQDDFVMLSSTIDRPYRPNFEQYMAVLTALSLANEFAHYKQDKNGSLRDWYNYQKQKQSQAACALYDLQQHVSDIVMMETAYKLDAYFRKNNDLKGSLSIQMALEKMWLDKIFWDYTIARTADQKENIEFLIEEMHKLRYKANMNSRKSCPENPIQYKFDKNIFSRALAPLDSWIKPLVQSAAIP